jgi:chaperonin GroES
MGVVVSVGPGKRRKDGSRRPLEVRVGQIILFGRYTDYDDGELLLIQEADVVGVVSDNEERQG